MEGIIVMNIRKGNIADIKGIAKVHVDSWKSTYDGIISRNYLDGLSYGEREEKWKHHFKQGFSLSSLFVAENEHGEIIGFANGGKERTGKYKYDGELYAIYLLKEYARQQIGKHLLKQVAFDLFTKGYQSMLVWVLAENPSRHFYEAFNPVEVDTQQIKIGSDTFEEIAYGWENLQSLLN